MIIQNGSDFGLFSFGQFCFALAGTTSAVLLVAEYQVSVFATVCPCVSVYLFVCVSVCLCVFLIYVCVSVCLCDYLFV